ncbi:MAG TPA: hypothetical protein VFR20_00085, partial [Burkholderiaceae bacterium]|nr:hypothetical protein [Burkholderiaceae bacterium]
MIDYTKLHNALAEGGLIVDTITAGRMQRCKVHGDKGGKKSGSYRLFDDELPLCLWWNWKTATFGAWVSDARPQTPADRTRQRELIEQARRERHQQQLAQWAENRVTLSRLFDAAGAITDACPAGIYLDRRGLSIPNSDALRF